MLLAAVALHLGQDSSALCLRVMEGPREEAVEGAEVRWIALGSNGLNGRPADPFPYSILVRDELFAVEPVATTAADGSARPSQPDCPGILCVSKDGRRGCALWSPNMRGELRIRLFRDWPLDVDVVDPAGDDLTGLGVCLRYATEGEAGYQDVPVTRVPIHSGRAHIQHAGFLQSSARSGGACYAALTGWIGDPVQTWIPREEPPFDRVALRVPPHGSLVLKIVDEDGKPAHAVDPVCLGVPGRLPRVVAWPQDPGEGQLAGGPGFIARTVDGDQIVFRHVAVGVKLEASARRNESSALTIDTCAGPTTAAATADAVFRLGRGLVNLRAQVVVPAGLSLQGPGLDAQQRLVLDLDEGGIRALDHELALLARSRTGELAAGLYTWLTDGWKPGPNDLGELRLEQPPCIVEGTVILASTRSGIAGVDVQLATSAAGSKHVRTTTDTNGAFRLCGYPVAKECEVFFFRSPADERKLPVHRTFRRGSRGVRVELE